MDQGLPISLRLPNPPPVYVGRVAEQRWLREALLRAPVTLLWGEGGLGKSALVRHVLHASFRDETSRTLFVSLRDCETDEHVAVHVMRVIVAAQQHASVDWTELLASPTALCSHVLDLAEASRIWVVLDDLHHATPDSVRDLLIHLAKYARHSRWISTTRQPPPAELLGQSLALRGMNERDLRRLARVVDPIASATSLEGALKLAQGSPWRLHQIQSGRSGAHRSPEQIVRDLPRSTLGCLRVLRMIDTPVPESMIGSVLPSPENSLDELERSGLIERSGEGVRLHDVTRDLMPLASLSGPGDTASSTDELRREIARALSARDEPQLRLTALRLWLEAGREDEAKALLDQTGDALLSGGYAIALWSRLEGALGPMLERWRLAVAIQLGGGSVLMRLHAPTSDDRQVRILWVRVLAAMGKVSEARTEAAKIREDATARGDKLLAFEAGYHEARATLNLGQLAEGIALLVALEPCRGANLAARDSLLAMSLALQGEREASLKAASEARQRLARTTWPASGEVALGVARALYTFGHLREASAVLDQASPKDSVGSVRFDAGRSLRFLRACIAFDTGDLRRTRAELLALEPYEQSLTIMRPYLQHARACVAMASGELDVVEAHLRSLARSTTPSYLDQELAVLTLQLRIERGDPSPVALSFKSDTVFSKLATALWLRHEVRHGRRDAQSALAELRDLLVAGAEHVEVRIVVTCAIADLHVITDNPSAACQHAESAELDAREHGFVVRESEALALRCDALVCLGHDRELRELSQDLGRMSEVMPSPRFAAVAALYEAILSTKSECLARLELVASSESSHRSGRLARALLSGSDVSDAADRAVLKAIRARPNQSWPQHVANDPNRDSSWRSGWGIDESTRQVWLPEGTRIDLSTQNVLWRLLHVLVTRSSATKEELTLSVWNEPDYHPLRHDNRLQATIRKLRRLIEPDPSTPVRILTTPDGYAVQGVRVM